MLIPVCLRVLLLAVLDPSLVVMGCLLLEMSLPLSHPGVEQDPTHNTGKTTTITADLLAIFLAVLFNNHTQPPTRRHPHTYKRCHPFNNVSHT